MCYKHGKNGRKNVENGDVKKGAADAEIKPSKNFIAYKSDDCFYYVIFFLLLLHIRVTEQSSKGHVENVSDFFNEQVDEYVCM